MGDSCGWVGSAYDPVLVRPHRLTRSFASLGAVVLIGAFLAGCSEGEQAAWTEAAATVNGVEISQDLLVQTTQGANDIEPGGQSLSTNETTGVLDRLVSIELARQELDDLGVELTEEDREVARNAVYASMGQDPATGAVDVERGRQLFEESPEGFQQAFVDLQAILDKLAANLPEGAGDVERCASFVQINPGAGDQDDQVARAEEILDGLRDGDDIQQHIEAETTDPTTPGGGTLGCATEQALADQVAQGALPAEIADPIFETGLGEPFGPVVLDQGVYVVLVESETFGQDAALQYIDQLSLHADVWINPRNGIWTYFDATGAVTDDPEEAIRRGVAPPEGPEPPPLGSDTTAVVPGDPSATLVPGP